MVTFFGKYQWSLYKSLFLYYYFIYLVWARLIALLTVVLRSVSPTDLFVPSYGVLVVAVSALALPIFCLSDVVPPTKGCVPDRIV